MQLGKIWLDKTKDEYLFEMAELVQSKKTLIVIDTNILGYLYKFHSAARQEFFKWAGAAQKEDHLIIPTWCATEYLNRVVTRGLGAYTPELKTPNQPQKILEAMLETASLFVDNKILKEIQFNGDRNAFLSEFKSTIDNLNKFTRIFKDTQSPQVVHEEILEHLSPAIIKSDINAICIRASLEGDARFSQRIPPGYNDDNKTENKYGDLIIWFEILQYANMKSNKFDNVVLVTNDQKSDWVYAPEKITQIDNKGTRKAITNKKPEIKIIDPRLEYEFKSAVPHSDIHICSLSVLIETLSKRFPTDFWQISAAIQISTALLDSQRSNQENENPDTFNDKIIDGSCITTEVGDTCSSHTQSENIQHSETTRNKLNYTQNALRDREYQPKNATKVIALIKNLKSHNWYVQNPVFSELHSINEEPYDHDSLFVLGRNIYQAACGNSQKAVDFIMNIGENLSKFRKEIANDILAGVIYEIYFNSNGEFRKTPKSNLIEEPLRELTNKDNEQVACFIRQSVATLSAQLAFTPGSSEPKKCVIKSNPIENQSKNKNNKRKIFSIEIDNTEKIDNFSQHTFWHFVDDELNIEELMRYISRQLAIPYWALQHEFNPEIELNSTFCFAHD